jgi:hypothetical protein
VNVMFSRIGLKALRAPLVTFVSFLAASVVIVAASHYYLEFERRDDKSSEGRMRTARARLDAIRKEREDMRTSAETFRELLDRGMLNEEKRLDLLEMVDRLKTEYHIVSLDYEVLPQRALQLPGGRAFHAIEVFSSRVRLKVQALHDGDLLGFIDGLVKQQRSFFNLDRCVVQRMESGASGLYPRVEADCAMEWITVRDKRMAKAKGA